MKFTTNAFLDRHFKGTVAPGQPRLNATMKENKVTYTVVIDVDNSNREIGSLSDRSPGDHGC